MKYSNNKAKWILRPKYQRNAKMRLFCFPYAGSSGMVSYKFLVDSLPNSIEVCPIELPGRGLLINEKLISNLDEVVNGISEEMKDFFDLPFVFFGHSMGALISYELTHKIYALYNRTPQKLYISAYRVPSIERNEKIMHKLGIIEFKSELLKIDGIAQDIWEHEELMDLMLPIIKNDYKLCETYKYLPKEKLQCHITAFGGTDDKDVTKVHLADWNKFTACDFELVMFEGDHFFMVKNKKIFIDKFSQMLFRDLNSIYKNNL